MKCYQIELWQECNTKCVYCYNHHLSHPQSSEFKIKNINKAIEIFKDDTLYDEFDTVGLIGGEFFQGQMDDPAVEAKFFELMELFKQKTEEGRLKGIWVSATLILGDQHQFYKMLDMFKDITLPDYFWVVTSYDPVGRFHTDKMFHDWENNLYKIRDEYPNIHVNTCSVLTGAYIDQYLADNNFITDFMDKYNTTIFIKSPTAVVFDDNGDMVDKTLQYRQDYNRDVIPNWFPTRDQVLNFFYTLKLTNPEIYDSVLNIKQRSDVLVRYYEGRSSSFERRYKDQRRESMNESVIKKCGHMINYQVYVDSTECMLCDKEVIDNALS